MKAKHQALMAANTSFCFQDAMDRIWFDTNILFSTPTAIFNIKAFSETPDLLSHSSSVQPVPKQESRFKSKRPTRLNVVFDQPCLSLQELPTGIIRSCPSFPTMSSALQPESCNDRIAMKQFRSHKSLTELENYELKGFMDLGFVFRKEELSMEIMSIIPGLQRLGIKNDRDEDRRSREEEEGVERPYLSEAWMTSRHDFSVVSLPLLPRSPYGADMKRQLRSWARGVASVIHHSFVDRF